MGNPDHFAASSVLLSHLSAKEKTNKIIGDSVTALMCLSQLGSLAG